MNDIQSYHANIKYKSNKYVYFNDNTHMSHDDFHKLCNKAKDENNKIIRNKVDGSQVLLVMSEEDAYNYYTQIDYTLHMIEQLKTTDQAKQYKEYWERAEEDKRKLRDKLVATARRVYQNLHTIRDFETGDRGIKFIIQTNKDGNEYRFCYDPYQIMPNYHSELSEIYRDNDWYTINGGWMKIEGNTLRLFGRSGDYGVFDKDIAMKAAQKVLGEFSIISEPELDLPF